MFLTHGGPQDGSRPRVFCPGRDRLTGGFYSAYALSAVKGSGRVVVALAFLRSRECLQIEVRDTGPDIQPALLGKVFDEGVSTKSSGRGLGLSLLREAERSHIGTMAAQYSLCFSRVMQDVREMDGPAHSAIELTAKAKKLTTPGKEE